MVEFDCKACGSHVLGFGTDKVPESELCALCTWFAEMLVTTLEQALVQRLEELMDEDKNEKTEDKSKSLGDQPIQPDLLKLMNTLASIIDGFLNDAEETKNGFVLLVAPFGAGGRANYISNIKRADVLTLLKDQVAKFEADTSHDLT